MHMFIKYSGQTATQESHDIGKKTENRMVSVVSDNSPLIAKPIRIPLIYFSRPSSEMLYPPKGFIETISSKTARKSKNYTLLSWLLDNDSDVSLTIQFGIPEDPFRLFNSQNNLNYHSLFNFQDKKNENLNKTVAPMMLRLSIFPNILQNTKLAQFRMDKLCAQYIEQFVKVLHEFSVKNQKKKLCEYLKKNLVKLIQSYVRDVFHDIVHKWVGWSRHLEENEMNLSKFKNPHEISIQIKKIIEKYWMHNMVIGQKSFRNFVKVMDNTTNLVSNFSKSSLGIRIVYGIWIDSQNGILLLCNGLVSSCESCLSPTMGSTLEENHLDTVKKLILFLNCSILECCSQQLNMSSDVKKPIMK